MDSGPQPNLDHTDSDSTRWWRWLTVAAIALVLTGLVYWIGGNRSPVHWDESEFLNGALADFNYQRLQGWRGLAASLLNQESYRPPAHRLLVLPMTLVFGVQLSALRIMSLVILLAAIAFVYLSATIVSDRAAGFFAALLFGICSGTAMNCRLYGTEPATYLATAASIYFLFTAIVRDKPSRATWLGLGLFMGLGVLAKLSFPWVIGPILIGCVILRLLGRLHGMTLWQFAASAILAATIAAPWYIKNFSERYLWLARQSQHFARMSSGQLSAESVRLWFSSILTEGFGIPLADLMLVTLAAAVFAFLLSSHANVRRVWIPITLCLIATVPFPAAQLLFSTNHVIRIITPAFIPLYIAVALLAQAAGLLRLRSAVVVTAIASAWQLYAVILPMSVWVWNGWDFHPIFDMADTHRVPAPRIAFLGTHPNLNHECVITPFLEHQQNAVATSLWQYLLPLDWKQIHDQADSSDIVLVAPNYTGEGLGFERWDLDNAHNAEFDRWLRESGKFEPPITFNPDPERKVAMNVYFHKPGNSAH